MINLKELTIEKAHNHLIHGDFSAVELAEAYLARISERDGEVHAYLEIFDDVLEQARAADVMLAEKGSNAPLVCGIPLAIKDNILIKGRRVSCASKILEGYTATYDACAIKKLKEQGAVFLGRTNMDEFAMGSSTENSAFGMTKNPLDLSRVPGGSSGGSAAALAADMALGALGSETGGSVRQPAAFCGLVGLKPTYGAVSRSGLVAMASSLDQIAPFGKTCEDTRILFDAIAGHDPLDSTSYPEEARAAAAARAHAPRKVLGVPFHLFEETKGVDEDVMENFRAALTVYETLGYEIRPVTLPSLSYALAVYYIVMPAEVSSNLARFDGVRYGLYKEGATGIDDYAVTRGAGFGREARRRILLGTYVLSAGYYDAYYNKAVAVRRMIEADFAKAFADVDAILTPTTPTPAFKAGEKTSDPLAMYLSDIFTVSANIAGIPALSVPSGVVVRDGVKLPVGLQIMASRFCEEALLGLGELFESTRS